MAALDSIARLRQVAARLAEVSPPGDPLAAWFASAFARYSAGASSGLTLEQALDLDCVAGERAWWTIEKLQARDAGIRELAAKHFPGIPARVAARGIRRLMPRVPPPPSAETIRKILGNETPAFRDPSPLRGLRS
jgi:hypothetical protein